MRVQESHGITLKWMRFFMRENITPHPSVVNLTIKEVSEIKVELNKAKHLPSAFTKISVHGIFVEFYLDFEWKDHV